jgi:SAM-dependent MidA family methyltransferase
MNAVAVAVRKEIACQGAITYAHFMRLALYCPQFGFYERESDTVGRSGHFITNASIGHLFGELLAFEFARWCEPLPEGPVMLVEAGGHDGQLALDILNWLSTRRPRLHDRVSYHLIEPSPRRMEWQRTKLKDHLPQVRWHPGLEALEEGGIHGVVFCNELLDAMPVHRFGWDANAGGWFEWGVTVEDSQFVWCRLPLTSDAALSNPGAPESQRRIGPPRMPVELLRVLPDGFTTEVCPEAENWWRTAARSLRNGRLLTIDYGLEEEEFFQPSRSAGTARAYSGHHLIADLLQEPGMRDLTAHVNFSSLIRAGEAEGCVTERFCSQTDFLMGIAGRALDSRADFGGWDESRRRQLQTLIHPEHMGRPFRVLLQSR